MAKKNQHLKVAIGVLNGVEEYVLGCCDKAGLGLGLGSGFRLGSRLGLGLGLVLGS